MTRQELEALLWCLAVGVLIFYVIWIYSFAFKVLGFH